jgi:hypothetical protein
MCKARPRTCPSLCAAHGDGMIFMVRCGSMNHDLFVAQRDHRIYAGSAVRGNPASH